MLSYIEHIGAVPQKEVKTRRMYWLHCLAHIDEPSLLLIPEDVVLRQVSMDEVADGVELLHHLNHLLIGHLQILSRHVVSCVLQFRSRLSFFPDE